MNRSHLTDQEAEAMARAHDAEDAAHRGEPSPWDERGEDYEAFRAERIAAMRAAWAVSPGPPLAHRVRVAARALDEFFAYLIARRIITAESGTALIRDLRVFHEAAAALEAAEKRGAGT